MYRYIKIKFNLIWHSIIAYRQEMFSLLLFLSRRKITQTLWFLIFWYIQPGQGGPKTRCQHDVKRLLQSQFDFPQFPASYPFMRPNSLSEMSNILFIERPLFKDLTTCFIFYTLGKYLWWEKLSNCFYCYNPVLSVHSATLAGDGEGDWALERRRLNPS